MADYKMPKPGDAVEIRRYPNEGWTRTVVKTGHRHSPGAEIWAGVGGGSSWEFRHVSLIGPWGGPFEYDPKDFVWRWPLEEKPTKEEPKPKPEVVAEPLDFPSEEAKILYYYGSLEMYRRFTNG